MKKKVEDNEPIPILQSIATSLGGIMFTIFFTWFIVNIQNEDIWVYAMLLPFWVAGVAATLQGLLPIAFHKNQGLVKNIGIKIYIGAFFTYWFLFLIIFDYTAIVDKDWQMFIFSLLFWAVGIFSLVITVKKGKQ